jgi:hypothetical protein
MNKKPLISIVIPCRRPKLLYSCIASLKNNDLNNVEIVVSLNFVKNSKNILQNCKKILQKKNTNIKIYSTKKHLVVHKSWEFAISNANGSWIMMLCEDDLIIENGISILKKNISNDKNCNVFTWWVSKFLYTHDEKKLTYYSKHISICNNAPKKIYSNKILKKIIKENDWHSYKNETPFFPNCIINKKIFKKKDFTPFFFDVEPMYSSTYRILTRTKYFKLINQPITILGETSISNSNYQNNIAENNKDKKKLIKEFKKDFNPKFENLKKNLSEIKDFNFSLFNRLVSLEVMMRAIKFLPELKKYNFKLNKKNVLKQCYIECLNRAYEQGTSYDFEIKSIEKLIDYKLIKFKFFLIKKIIFFTSFLIKQTRTKYLSGPNQINSFIDKLIKC